MPSKAMLGARCRQRPRAHPFHPVRDYFEALKWDETPQIDRWLVTYLHADDTEYTPAVGPRFLVSAVARIYQPGCKVDHMLVLEGRQGKQKSEALRAVAIKAELYTDRLSHRATARP
jgi:predicted P-loop ATPase